MIDFTDDSAIKGPWKTNTSFLHAAFVVIAASVERLNGVRQVRDLQRQVMAPDRVIGPLRGVPVDEAKRRQRELELRERQLRERFSDALERHGQDDEAVPLGLNLLTEEAGLTEAEQWILLRLLPPSLSQNMGEHIYEDLQASIYGGILTVDALVELSVPKTLDDILAVHNLFTHDASLVCHGLIVVEHCARQVCPEDFQAAQVKLSWRAFGTLLGRPELAQDIPAGDE